MTRDDLTPPSPGNAFLAGLSEAVKSSMELIPGLALFTSQIWALGSRKKEWEWYKWGKSVTDELQRLGVSQNDFVEKLKSNEKAIEIMHLAMNEAFVSSEEVKVDALRNAFINSTLNIDSTIAREKMFMNYLKEFSGLHLHLLRIFDDPHAECVRQGKTDYGTKDFPNYMTLLNYVLPNRIQDLTMYNQVTRNLYSKELINVSDLSEVIKVNPTVPIQNSYSRGRLPGMSHSTYTLSEAAIHSRYTMHFGVEFLKFISSPIIPAS